MKEMKEKKEKKEMKKCAGTVLDGGRIVLESC